ncbi:MAG: hypothetical protein EZS28_008362, partial [Streblomastix strix]
MDIQLRNQFRAQAAQFADKRKPFEIDIEDLGEHNRNLVMILVHEAFTYERVIRQALYDFSIEFGEIETRNKFQEEKIDARINQFIVKNYKEISKIRELIPEGVECLVTITGHVVRASEVRPELVEGTFICGICGGKANEK